MICKGIAKHSYSVETEDDVESALQSALQELEEKARVSLVKNFWDTYTTRSWYMWFYRYKPYLETIFDKESLGLTMEVLRALPSQDYLKDNLPDFIRVINNLEISGKKKLSEKECRSIYRRLHQLTEIVAAEMDINNPLPDELYRGVTKRSAFKRQARKVSQESAFSQKQLNEIWCEVQTGLTSRKLTPMSLIFFLHGLSPEEISALTFNDLVFDKDRITPVAVKVNNRYVFGKKRWIKTNKLSSSAGYRTICLVPRAQAIIKSVYEEYIKTYGNYALKLPIIAKSTNSPKYVNPDELKKYINKLLNKLGVQGWPDDNSLQFYVSWRIFRSHLALKIRYNEHLRNDVIEKYLLSQKQNVPIGTTYTQFSNQALQNRIRKILMAVISPTEEEHENA